MANYGFTIADERAILDFTFGELNEACGTVLVGFNDCTTELTAFLKGADFNEMPDFIDWDCNFHQRTKEIWCNSKSLKNT